MDTFYYMGDYFFEFIIISICAYIYLAGIYFTNKRKEREINEQEDQLKIDAEKTRIATEMHDDLGADLSNLLFKLRIYQNRNGNKHLEEYHEIENFTKEIIKKVNETIWTLNSEKDTLISLIHFILKFLDELLGKDHISYTFKNEIDGPDIAIPIEVRRNIFHLFKETMRFILLSDGIENVEVTFKLNKSNLQILICFNGKHNEHLKIEQQNLLDLMQLRISILNAIYTNEINEHGKNEITYRIEI